LVIFQIPKDQITKISNSGGHCIFSGWDFFGVWNFGFCDFQQYSSTLGSLYDQNVVGIGKRPRRPFGARHHHAVEGDGHPFAPGVAEFIQQRQQCDGRNQRTRLVIDVNDSGLGRGTHFLSVAT
jgi:hypothetical protein